MRTKKTCETCMHNNAHYKMEEYEENYCLKYDCLQNEVAKEENPSCWEDFPPDYYDMHTCDYKNGCCTICGKIKYGSQLYIDIFGGE